MKRYMPLILLGFLFTVLIGTALAQDMEANNKQANDTEAFQQALEQDGFTVQEGELAYFDLLKLLEEGALPSAYGNNPTTKYLIYFVPPAPGYEVDEQISEITSTLGVSGNLTPFWNLRPDEAVVFVGRTPPECRYFSYDHYIMHRTYDNERRWLFANIADTVNNLVIKSEGTPDGEPGNPFNQTTVIIITADRGIDQRIRAAAQSAGYSDNITNIQVLPSVMLNMGLENDSDTFAAFVRPALINDTQAEENYINNTPATVFRITPNNTTELDPYDYPELRVRGTGQTEFDLMDDLEDLRVAILDRYNESNATELPISVWAPVGTDAIQRGINVLGPNNDAAYLWTANQTISSPTPPFFDTSEYYPFLRDPAITLGNDSNESIIVYGVNHVATGKAMYSNFAIYGADTWNGVRAISDADFSGSAEEYLPDNPNAKYLYAYKLSRNCSEDDQYCYEVPYGQGAYGLELDQPFFIGFRIYLENSTKTGPAYSEIVYDRAIKFDPMSSGNMSS
ncbi:hypothetical protein [Methanosarcina mazei]|uniref:Uncharacterized protein n=3 Tax=Methanosarcina mazei TaxID=2209 RepID=A0A0F8JUE2_METMZ|nr:hypothetical protein [Methanosarcina mazei]AKB71156.1 hypothetical protein MSMAC_1266 [Methanosarcina mazei C16]KKG18420.1 hypothetical protein DU34_13690 [Methanosarcina mazei]KKG31632.1 hypothetical protein DU49_13500 [Methanosarcina mazei]KKG38874.1 hypothetical protein DU35_14185 [Methanosarcina mazei]KKG43704.1 hypothetical protein DU39_13455 [Methanosarcina mazei]